MKENVGEGQFHEQVCYTANVQCMSPVIHGLQLTNVI